MIARRHELLLFVAALALRLLHVGTVFPGPLSRYLLIDSAFYDEVGRRLASGGGFPDGVFFMNILYGAFLGGVYTLTGAAEATAPGAPAGTPLLAVYLVQALLGSVAVVVLGRVGSRLGSPREGLLAAALLAVYGPAIFYDAALLTPSLLLFLTTALLLLAVRARGGCVRSAAAAGIVVGVLILGRANNALLLPVLGFLFWRARVRPAALVLFALLAVAVVVPATIRNARVSGEFVPVTANGGMALWAGNHPGATGIYSEPPFLSNPVPESEAEDYRAEASRREGRELTLAESSRYWVGATATRWAEEPGAMLALALRKVRWWLSATESQTNLSYYFAMDYSWVLRVFRLHFGWILPLAFLGLPAVRRLGIAAWPVGISLLTCAVFYMSSEYRHPVVPCVLLFTAAGTYRLVDAVRERAPVLKRAGLAALLLGLVFVVNFRDPFLERLQSRRVDFYNFGALAADARQYAEAEQFLRRSVRIDPAWAPSRYKLADVLHAQGRVREAADEKLHGDRLAGVVPDAVDTRLAEANRLFQGGRFAPARQLFLDLAAGSPEARAGALNNAGLCSMNLGEAALAESLFLAAAAAQPGYASPVVHLGRLALALGDSSGAVRRAEEALRIAPEDGRAQRLLHRARGGGEGAAPDR